MRRMWAHELRYTAASMQLGKYRSVRTATCCALLLRRHVAFPTPAGAPHRRPPRQEFLALTLFLRSATSTFKAFDPSNAGTVTLNYSQFLYATVNCV